MNTIKRLFLLVTVAVLWTSAAWANNPQVAADLAQKVQFIDRLIITAKLHDVDALAIDRAEKTTASAHRALDYGSDAVQTDALTKVNAAIGSITEPERQGMLSGILALLGVIGGSLLTVIAIAIVRRVKRNRQQAEVYKDIASSMRRLAERINDVPSSSTATVAGSLQNARNMIALATDTEVFYELVNRLTVSKISLTALEGHACYMDCAARNGLQLQHLMEQGQYQTAFELAQQEAGNNLKIERVITALLDRFEPLLALATAYVPLPDDLDTFIDDMRPRDLNRSVAAALNELDMAMAEIGSGLFITAGDSLDKATNHLGFLISFNGRDLTEEVLRAIDSSSRRLSELESEWDSLRALQNKLAPSPALELSISVLHEVVPDDFANARNLLTTKCHYGAYCTLEMVDVLLKNVRENFESHLPNADV